MRDGDPLTAEWLETVSTLSPLADHVHEIGDLQFWHTGERWRACWRNHILKDPVTIGDARDYIRVLEPNV